MQQTYVLPRVVMTRWTLVVLAALLTNVPDLIAQRAGPVDARLTAALTWRNLGPFRGGRVGAVSGAVPEMPD